MNHPIYHYFLKIPFALALFIGSLLIVGCSEEKISPEPAKVEKSTSQAATNLVETTDMPHKVDSATEFAGALESYDGRGNAEYRDTGSGVAIVRVEKAPAITKPGQSASTNAKPIEQDWDGTVLIPAGTQMSHAHTTDVVFRRIEAHPLRNGHLRVWVRIQNLTDQELNARVGCDFKSTGNEALKTAMHPTTIPANEAIDAYFMSPMPNVLSYTILVR